MRIYTIACPNCDNKQIQFNDSNQKVICPYCGTQIFISDPQKFKVNHSGTIEVTGTFTVDESHKAQNCLQIANRAFLFKNYEEAYEYYLKTLEYDGNNYLALFRKGYCATLLSPKRILEFKKAIDDAFLALENEAQWDSKYSELTNDIVSHVEKTHSNILKKKETFHAIIPTQEEINTYYEDLKILTELINQCITILPNEKLEEFSYLEEKIENIIKLGLKICQNGYSPLKCYNGTKKITNDAKIVVEKPSYKEYAPLYKDIEKEYAQKFKERYNTLPTTLKAISSFDNEICRHKENIKAFEDAQAKYFEENPSIKATYKSKTATFLILATFLLGLFTLSNDFHFRIVQAIFVLITLYLGFKSYEQYQYEKKAKEEIIKSYPKYLQHLMEKYKQSNIDLPIVQQEKADYLRKHTIK